MYEIAVSRTAQEEFGKLPKEVRRRVVAVLERASVNPHRHARRLSGEPTCRIRAGKYRIILDINEKEKRIEVLRIGHRERVYQ